MAAGMSNNWASGAVCVVLAVGLVMVLLIFAVKDSDHYLTFILASILVWAMRRVVKHLFR